MRRKFSPSVEAATWTLGPLSGHHVVGGLAGKQQVHRHHAELQRGAARQKQHAIGGRQPEQGAQVHLSFGEDGRELLGAMRHLEDADAALAERQ
jgi:hypothetical protein